MLSGGDAIGDTYGSEDWLAVLDGFEAVNRFADAGVRLCVGGFGIFPTQSIFGMAVVGLLRGEMRVHDRQRLRTDEERGLESTKRVSSTLAVIVPSH
jgi:hypothetical protein